MFGDDDMVPLGFNNSCLYCKQPYGVHDGLCADCVGRFSEGVSRPVARKSQAEIDAAYEEEERQHADAWHREQERRDFCDYS